jgi:Fe-S-cluster containining protein
MGDEKHPLDPRERPPEDPGDGLRFNHVVAMQTRQKVAELSASFYALVEAMIATGQLPLDEYERRRQLTVQRETERAQSEAKISLNDTPDKYLLAELPKIDCEARLHLCRARCCTLVFPLSVQDLDERVVRWDYARPYQIGRRPDGYCVHNQVDGCHCTIYEKRPAVCRTYDCRTDARIWVDFEKRIPAP